MLVKLPDADFAIRRVEQRVRLGGHDIPHDTIRRALIEADLVECKIALPGQLFTHTQIPACIWFGTKNKHDGSDRDVSNIELAVAA